MRSSSTRGGGRLNGDRKNGSARRPGLWKKKKKKKGEEGRAELRARNEGRTGAQSSLEAADLMVA